MYVFRGTVEVDVTLWTQGRMIRVAWKKRKAFDDHMPYAGAFEFVCHLCICALDFLKPQSRVSAIPIDLLADPLRQIVVVVEPIRRHDSRRRPSEKYQLPLSIGDALKSHSVRVLKPESAQKKVWYSVNAHPVPKTCISMRTE